MRSDLWDAVCWAHAGAAVAGHGARVSGAAGDGAAARARARERAQRRRGGGGRCALSRARRLPGHRQRGAAAPTAHGRVTLSKEKARRKPSSASLSQRKPLVDASATMCGAADADAAPSEKTKCYSPPDAPDALYKFEAKYDNVRLAKSRLWCCAPTLAGARIAAAQALRARATRSSRCVARRTLRNRARGARGATPVALLTHLLFASPRASWTRSA